MALTAVGRAYVEIWAIVFGNTSYFIWLPHTLGVPTHVSQTVMSDIESQDLNHVAALASNHIYALSTQIRQASKLANKVSHEHTITKASEKLSQATAHISANCTKTCDVVDQLSSWPTETITPAERKQVSEIQRSFKVVLADVQTLQRQVTKAMRNVSQAAANGAGTSSEHFLGGGNSGASENTPLIQVLDQLDQGELNIHQELLQDREHEIAEIQRGMLEINSIFKDLGVLVTEQGAHMDTVEDNIADLARQTEDAARQLSKANNYQKSRGKWSCIALLILLFITVVVALSIFA